MELNACTLLAVGAVRNSGFMTKSACLDQGRAGWDDGISQELRVLVYAIIRLFIHLSCIRVCSVKLPCVLHTLVNEVSTGSSLCPGLYKAVNASKIDLTLHSSVDQTHEPPQVEQRRANVTVSLR